MALDRTPRVNAYGFVRGELPADGGALVFPKVGASMSFSGFAGIGVIGLTAGLIALLGPQTNPALFWSKSQVR